MQSRRIGVFSRGMQKGEIWLAALFTASGSSARRLATARAFRSEARASGHGMAEGTGPSLFQSFDQ
jgi:hypothetical protein